MRQPEWTEILLVIGLTVALGLLAPGPRPRPSVSATAAPAPPASASDGVVRDRIAPPPVTVPVTSPR
jgi:hypothetical protein